MANHLRLVHSVPGDGHPTRPCHIRHLRLLGSEREVGSELLRVPHAHRYGWHVMAAIAQRLRPDIATDAALDRLGKSECTGGELTVEVILFWCDWYRNPSKRWKQQRAGRRRQ